MENKSHSTESLLISLNRFIASYNEKNGTALKVKANSVIGNKSIISEKDINQVASNYERAIAVDHGSSRKGKVVEITPAGEYGVVLEEGWGVYYISGFINEEAALLYINEYMNSDYTFVGVQAFLVKDIRVWRKEFADG